MKYKGIRKACGRTKSLKGFYGDTHLQLNVGLDTGEVWVDEHLGNNWSQYKDKNVISCGNIYNPMTMEEIRRMVDDAIAYSGR